LHLDINMSSHHDAGVRTTLTIEDDVARELRRVEQRTHRRLKEIVNDLLRRGLAAGDRPLAKPEPFTVKARASGFVPGVDLLKLNQLADAMETEPRRPRERRRLRA